MTASFLRDHPSFCSMVERFRSGESTPREFLESCIAAIERNEPRIRALVSTDLERARELADASGVRYAEGRALSPIDGMPVGIKDIIDTSRMPTQMNSAIYADHVARGDAAAVRALLEGGAIPLAKTVTTEFAIGRSGPTCNPHDPDHTPGGSSSGSAAGTAAGMFPAAFGTQTQGSIIRPASFCGVVGYKPTRGALSLDGVHPLSGTHDHLGVLADSVNDAWWLARWVSEVAPPQDRPGLSGPVRGVPAALPLGRVAVLRTGGFDELDGDSRGAFESACKRLQGLGVELVDPADDPALQEFVQRLDGVPAMSLAMVAYDMRWPYSGYLEAHPDKLGPRFVDLMGQARAISRDRYRELLRSRDELAARAAALGESYDAFVLPASSGPAPQGFDYTGSRTLLVYSSFLGLPAYSLPLMSVGTLPLGLQLVGHAHADYRLTRHAQWLSQAWGAE